MAFRHPNLNLKELFQQSLFPFASDKREYVAVKMYKSLSLGIEG